ncbi:hypothetical protein TNCT_699971 [Trichonephila clavata]|uniref:Uncharacterized protein n=1 Tax=Trichonephila clavata TaxID=2740835 RepID=A0A8X6FV37_TRICU|nr:hypothetical protein TNCT_699971 [Trichonephila clavata]
MNGHEERSPPGKEAMQLGTDPLPTAPTANPTSLAHCAQIKNAEKLIKIKELRIKSQQVLIDIETFDKDCTDPAQLAALIKEKAQAELEVALKMGELKVLFPCPVNCCKYHVNGINSFRTQNSTTQN